MGSYFDSNLPCDIEDVVNLLGIRIVRNTGTQLHCRCPFCDDRHAHMNVRLDRNVFRCNRCGKGGGVLHLYAGVHDIPLNTAYEELCRIFRHGENCENLRRKKIQRKQIIVTPEFPLATSEVRDNTYSNLLSLLSLGGTHREALLKRGLSMEEIEHLGYRTTPAVRSSKIVAELLERGCDLKGVPGFYCDKETGRWKLDIRGSGIMLPDRNETGEIEAIQIRLDDTSKSKFNNLTSRDRYCGTAASCCPHFVGVEPNIKSVYLTEGIMKSDIAHHLSVRLGQPRAFIGITGVGNINQVLRAIDYLTAMGIRTIKLAFDMDARVNKNVQASKERVLETGRQAGFDMTPITWDPAYKGIDDFFLSLVKQRHLA